MNNYFLHPTIIHTSLCLQDLCIYDDELTASKVLEIVSVEDLAVYDGTHSNLELEVNSFAHKIFFSSMMYIMIFWCSFCLQMTFLEFFEALLGCAEVKGKKTQTAENGSDTDHQYQTVQNITHFITLFQINHS